MLKCNEYCVCFPLKGILKVLWLISSWNFYILTIHVFVDFLFYAEDFPCKLSPVFTNGRYNCYWVSILSLQITKLPWEMFRRGGSPRTTNWNPGVFLEPRGVHLPRSALSLTTTTTTTSPKICSRIVLCSPREEILLCEILLCRSWQSRADGWAVVMNYKSYCYRGATAAAEGDLRITPTATTDPYSD